MEEILHQLVDGLYCLCPSSPIIYSVSEESHSY